MCLEFVLKGCNESKVQYTETVLEVLRLVLVFYLVLGSDVNDLVSSLDDSRN